MSASRGRCLWPLFTAAAVLSLGLAGPGRAEEKGKKDEAKKPDVVQIDLSKLPPDLAAQLRRLAEGEKKPDGKGQQAGKKGEDAKGKKTEPRTAQGAKPPMTGTKGDEDLSRRLRKLSDDLRRLADEIDGKKPSSSGRKKGEDEKKKKGDEDEKGSKKEGDKGKKKDDDKDEKGNKNDKDDEKGKKKDKEDDEKGKKKKDKDD